MALAKAQDTDKTESFIQPLVALVCDRRLSHAAFRLACLLIAKRDWKTQAATISAKTLAFEMGYSGKHSADNISRLTKELEDAGWLRIERGHDSRTGFRRITYHTALMMHTGTNREKSLGPTGEKPAANRAFPPAYQEGGQDSQDSKSFSTNYISNKNDSKSSVGQQGDVGGYGNDTDDVNIDPTQERVANREKPHEGSSPVGDDVPWPTVRPEPEDESTFYGLPTTNTKVPF